MVHIIIKLYSRAILPTKSNATPYSAIRPLVTSTSGSHPLRTAYSFAINTTHNQAWEAVKESNTTRHPSSASLSPPLGAVHTRISVLMREAHASSIQATHSSTMHSTSSILLPQTISVYASTRRTRMMQYHHNGRVLTTTYTKMSAISFLEATHKLTLRLCKQLPVRCLEMFSQEYKVLKIV